MISDFRFGTCTFDAQNEGLGKIFKKYAFSRTLRLFEHENFNAHAPRARKAKLDDFSELDF